jgi:hypothetical protein
VMWSDVLGLRQLQMLTDANKNNKSVCAVLR